MIALADSFFFLSHHQQHFQINITARFEKMEKIAYKITEIIFRAKFLP